MKFYLPQVLLILKLMVLRGKKKKKVWNRNKYEAKPNLGNSHLLNPPLLKATEVFQPLLPYHFSRDFGKKKCLRI